MVPTAQQQRPIPRTAAVALALVPLGAAVLEWLAYRDTAPAVPRLVRIELGLDRSEGPRLLHDTLLPDALLIVCYGSALVALCWLARMMTWTKRARALADFGILCAAEVTAEFAASWQTSGCRRITAALNRRGSIECSVGLVADLMRELGLAAGLQRTTVAGKEP